MNISLPNASQAASLWRSALNAAGVLITGATAMALLPQATGANLLADIQHLKNAGQELWLAFGGSTGLIALGGAFYLNLLAHTQKATVQAAASIPGTTVVTTPDLATATPDQSNIVSNTKVAVVPKTA